MTCLGPEFFQEANELNAALPPEIREMGSAQQLANWSYALSRYETGQLPHCIYLMTEEGRYERYSIFEFEMQDEVYAYYFLPKDKSRNEIRIAFRGTELKGSIEKKIKSALVNLQPGGPGHLTFEKEKALIFRQLRAAIKQHYGHHRLPLTLHVTGHSQGGALAQLFADEFMSQRLQTADFNRIRNFNLTLFNSPGISHSIVQRANENYIIQKATKPLDLKINFGLNDHDPVQMLGEDMFGAIFPSFIADVNLFKIEDGIDDDWRRDLSLESGLCPSMLWKLAETTLKNIQESHLLKRFLPLPNEKGVFSAEGVNYRYFSNKISEHAPVIISEALNKLSWLCRMGYSIADKFGITSLLTHFVRRDVPLETIITRNKLFLPSREIAIKKDKPSVRPSSSSLAFRQP